MSIRFATVADAPEIVEINLEGWQTAYRGIFPDEFLDSLNFEVEKTAKIIAEKPETTLVFTDDNQKVLGFCSFGELRWEQFVNKCDCELNAIYVASVARGQGIGKALFKATTDLFRKQGKKRLLVNVLADNESALAFYKNLGGVEIGNKDFVLLEVNYPQNVLVFEL